MSDDGTGAGLRIPSVLIGMRDGQKLMDFFNSASKQAKRSVSININFMKPHPQNIVDFTFWFTSADFRSLMFLQNIMEMLVPILDKVNFKPRQVVWSCPQCDQDFRQKNCFSDGKYCAVSHDLTMQFGSDIVLEDLRIHCLWDLLKNTDKKHKFFDYIKTAHDFCPDEKINESCHDRGMRKINMTNTELNKCLHDTFAQKGNKAYNLDENHHLAEELSDWQTFGTHLYPAVEVNGVKFRGQINPDNVFEDICMGFISMPRECKRFLKKEGIAIEDTGISTKQLAMVIFGVVLLNIVLFIIYRNHLNKELNQEMKMQVSSEVSKYVALSQIKELN